MADEAKKNQDELITQALEWYEGNLQKNEGARRERHAEEKLKKLVSDGELRTVEVSETHDMQIGFMDVEDEEIDPKLLFAANPEAFWELVSVAKTNCISLLGEKEAAKYMQPTKKHKFKVKKIKKSKKR